MTVVGLVGGQEFTDRTLRGMILFQHVVTASSVMLCACLCKYTNCHKIAMVGLLLDTEISHDVMLALNNALPETSHHCAMQKTVVLCEKFQQFGPSHMQCTKS